MPSEYSPLPGAAGWQFSNPSVIDVVSLLASLEVFEQSKSVDDTDGSERHLLANLRKKSIDLTGNRLPLVHHHNAFGTLEARVSALTALLARIEHAAHLRPVTQPRHSRGREEAGCDTVRTHSSVQHIRGCEGDRPKCRSSHEGAARRTQVIQFQSTLWCAGSTVAERSVTVSIIPSTSESANFRIRRGAQRALEKPRRIGISRRTMRGCVSARDSRVGSSAARGTDAERGKWDSTSIFGEETVARGMRGGAAPNYVGHTCGNLVQLCNELREKEGVGSLSQPGGNSKPSPKGKFSLDDASDHARDQLR